jgi:hypothetical protein
LGVARLDGNYAVPFYGDGVLGHGFVMDGRVDQGATVEQCALGVGGHGQGTEHQQDNEEAKGSKH